MFKLILVLLTAIFCTSCAYLGRTSSYELLSDKYKKLENQEECKAKISFDEGYIILTPTERNHIITGVGPLILPIPLRFSGTEEMNSLSFGFLIYSENEKIREELRNNKNWRLKVNEEELTPESMNEHDILRFKFSPIVFDSFILTYKSDNQMLSNFEVRYKHHRRAGYIPFAIYPVLAGPCA